MTEAIAATRHARQAREAPKQESEERRLDCVVFEGVEFVDHLLVLDEQQVVLAGFEVEERRDQVFLDLELPDYVDVQVALFSHDRVDDVALGLFQSLAHHSIDHRFEVCFGQFRQGWGLLRGCGLGWVRLRLSLGGRRLLARVLSRWLFGSQLLGELVRFPQEGVCGVGQVLVFLLRRSFFWAVWVVQESGLERLLRVGLDCRCMRGCLCGRSGTGGFSDAVIRLRMGQTLNRGSE